MTRIRVSLRVCLEFLPNVPIAARRTWLQRYAREFGSIYEGIPTTYADVTSGAWQRFDYRPSTEAVMAAMANDVKSETNKRIRPRRAGRFVRRVVCEDGRCFVVVEFVPEGQDRSESLERGRGGSAAEDAGGAEAARATPSPAIYLALAFETARPALDPN